MTLNDYVGLGLMIALGAPLVIMIWCGAIQCVRSVLDR